MITKEPQECRITRGIAEGSVSQWSVTFVTAMLQNRVHLLL